MVEKGHKKQGKSRRDVAMVALVRLLNYYHSYVPKGLLSKNRKNISLPYLRPYGTFMTAEICISTVATSLRDFHSDMWRL